MYDGVDSSLLANDGGVLVSSIDNSVVFGDAIIFSNLFSFSHALISLSFLMKICTKKKCWSQVHFYNDVQPTFKNGNKGYFPATLVLHGYIF